MSHRGEFKKKRVDIKTDTTSLFDIQETDVEGELSSIKKIRSRIEKNNERLVQEENSLLEQAENWQREIESLDLQNRNTTERLEERLRKLEFDWQKDRQTEERELEKLSLEFEQLEKYLFIHHN